MKRKGIILLLSAVLALALTGCQLARETAAPGVVQPDRLIGTYVTEDFLSPELLDGDGRLWADCSQGLYSFPGLTGWQLYAAHVSGDDGHGYNTANIDLVDGRTHFNSTDGEIDALNVSGTLVLLKGQELTLHMNPVYQTADGRVYMKQGDSFYQNTNELYGLSSLTISETTTVTENGAERTYTGSAEVNLQAAERPERIVVLQMDGENNEVARREYEPGHVDDEITVEAATVYLLVESHSADGSVERQLVDGGTESFRTLYDRGDGTCGQGITLVHWPDGDAA